MSERLSLQDYAALVGKSYHTVYGWVKSGMVVAIYNKGRWEYPEETERRMKEKSFTESNARRNQMKKIVPVVEGEVQLVQGNLMSFQDRLKQAKARLKVAP